MPFFFNPTTGNLDYYKTQDLSAYIPYVGATADLNLGSQNLQTGGSIKDSSANDVLKVENRQLITPDGTAIFDWSNNDCPTFKSYSGTSGFYFEGTNTPYMTYDGIDKISTGNYNRFVFNIPYVGLYILEDASGFTALDAFNRYLVDNSGYKAMEFNTTYRQLFDFGGIYPSVDFGYYQLWNIGISNSVPLLDWSTSANGSVKIYYGYNNAVVGDFTNCQLNDTNNSLRVDWLNMYLYDNMNQVAVDWNYHTLWYLGSITVDWQNKYLVHDGGGGSVNSIEWGNFKLNNSGGFMSIDYSNHILYDQTGSNGVLNFAGAAAVITGSAYASNGAIWYDTTRLGLVSCLDDVYQTLVGCIFTQTATGTAANTVAETTISSTGVGTLTLPANFFVAGKKIRIEGCGIHSGTASPNITIKIKFGSTVILTTGAVATGNTTNEGFTIMADITCRTTGVSGTVMAGGNYIENASTPRSFGMVNTSTVTVNTTTSQTITVTAQWSAASASNTISLQDLAVTVLN